MSKGRISMGFKQEYLDRADAGSKRSKTAPLLRFAVISLGLIAVITGLVLATDMEQLVYPRTIILRGNRLTSAADVVALTGMGRDMKLASLLPRQHTPREGSSRWIRSWQTRVLPGRRMLLTVDERMPLLPLEISGNAYWICSDGDIVLRHPEKDIDGRFEELNRLPLVSMQGSGIDAEYEIAEMLLLTAGVCREQLDRRITGIEVSANGEFNLRTDKGLLIQIGTPVDEDDIRRRLSTLPKAIRISDQYSDATAIDLRNGKVAYLRTGESE